MDFYKVNGASQRQDSLIRISDNNYLLIFGFGNDSDNTENGYNWRKTYNHKPTESELRSDIETLVNSLIDEKIKSGFTWSGKKVWLSIENQVNYKAAYDLAVQTEGATLPVTFKLGEDENGTTIYHTFTNLSSFTDFYTKAVAFIIATLKEGWTEKDSINYNKIGL